MVERTKPGAISKLVDWEHGRIRREIFVSEEIFAQELEQIFARTWLMVGHESQIAKPGDYFVARMGKESVIMSRDRQDKIHVFLNSCMHRGMKVCRYDEGNTAIFTCPYHGWSYGLDGSLVGVPHFKDYYFNELKKEEWGLVEVPKMVNYKGTIWACWDKDAPSFEEYMGGMLMYLDAVLDHRDGRPGGSEVVGGMFKWRFPANWKFGAENQAGDHYHGISHRSEVLIGTGPGGPGTERHGGAGRNMRGNVAFTRLGHCSGGGIPVLGGTHGFPPFPNHPIIQEYYDHVEAEREKNVGKKLLAPAATGNIFPHTALHGWFPRTIGAWFPHGPMETEGWRWYLVDKDAPEEVKEHLRRYSQQYGGPVGMTETDDMENWNYATEASSGTIARRYDYNYEMGLGHNEIPVEGLEDAVFSPNTSEQNPRWMYKRWAEMMEADSWADLYPIKKD